jgi:hypothetical protein
MLETKWVFFEWPYGPFKGKEVRRYHTLFGKYNIENWGNTLYVVTVTGKAGPRGGPDTGVQFKTLVDALDHIAKEHTNDLVH